MIKGILQSEAFYCNHLGMSDNDEKDIAAFEAVSLEGEGLRSGFGERSD